MSLAEIKTERNIMQAYKEEARAKGTFLAFAERAEEEGKRHLAKLFRAAAASEDVLSHSLIRALRETTRVTTDLWESELYVPQMGKDSAENLRQAIKFEMREVSQMYPQMIEDAKRDGWDFACDCFTQARAVEQNHVRLFNEALKGADRLATTDYFVCEFCGNTTGHKPHGPCSVCDAPKSAFQMVH